MNSIQFAAAWTKNGSELTPFDPTIINQIELSAFTKDFLLTGLPPEAAPFMTFGKATGATLQTPSEEFDIGHEFSKYLIIGFNGYGDPICIDKKNESIVYLNHDDKFAPIFLNSSLSNFTQFLLLFREFIEEILANEENKTGITENYTNRFTTVSSHDFIKGAWDKELMAMIEE